MAESRLDKICALVTRLRKCGVDESGSSGNSLWGYVPLVILVTALCYGISQRWEDALFGFVVIVFSCLLIEPMLGTLTDSPDAMAPPWLMRLPTPTAGMTSAVKIAH